MNLQSKHVCILAIVVLLSACAPTAPTIRMPSPTLLHTPTALSSSTTTPQPAATALPCLPGYGLHVDIQMGFSACYPTGWSISRRQDLGPALTHVDFTAPAPDSSTRAGLRFVSVSVSPAIPVSSDAEFLREINNWLIQEYHQRLLRRPDRIEVDGWKAVDAGYEATVVFGREVVEVTRWVTVLRVEDQQWFIEVAGRSQYREELDRIRSQLLSRFHLLSL